jgi:hypothetical protein
MLSGTGDALASPEPAIGYEYLDAAGAQTFPINPAG